VVLGEDHVGLLQAAGGDHGVNLADLNGVEVLDGLLDQGLGGTTVNDKDKGVVVFDGLDGRLRGSGLLYDCVLVPSDDLVDTVHDCLGLAGKSEGLRASEGGVVPLLGFGSGVRTLLDLFSNLLSLQGSIILADTPTYLFRHLCPPNL